MLRSGTRSKHEPSPSECRRCKQPGDNSLQSGSAMIKQAMLLIETVECPRNLLFRYRVEDYLQANGFEIKRISGIEKVDLAQTGLVVFCTCGFTVPIQEKQIKYIKLARAEMERQGSPAELVVTGCLSDMNLQYLQENHNGPIIGHQNLEAFDDLINAATPIAEIPSRNHVSTEEKNIQLIYAPDIVDQYKKLEWLATGFPAVVGPEKTVRRRWADSRSTQAIINRDFPFYQLFMGDETWCVKISTGCQGNCSYCAIRRAKGRLASRPLEDVVGEIQNGIDKGYEWVSLIADDSGAYGRDIGLNFGHLLNAMTEIKGNFGIIIDSLNAHHLNTHIDDLIRFFESGKKAGLVLAVQHVNERILKSMNRHCEIELLKENLIRLNNTTSQLALEYHFITGYPGETEEEFKELEEFARWSVNLNTNNGWHAFVFSPQPGTKAAEMEGQIPEEIRIARGKRLQTIHAEVYGIEAPGAGPKKQAGTDRSCTDGTLSTTVEDPKT